ncbi:unnamed protein product [Clonostachys rhizophaga]|uniref:Major facilitator superfamily (MFS) profile domain-containing protein n=1 Tax=Clonostachys rhizophaga TaxID=160324 RepID=A0A9N9VKA3_9HYPO|nr:unnamed protein product [Clonostachys rhizophaga]
MNSLTTTEKPLEPPLNQRIGDADESPGPRDKQPSSPPRAIHGWRWAVAYAAMLSTTFLFALDNTIVADIQPAIISDFGSVELLPWVGTGFALGTMAILPWGKAYGVLNNKWAYVASILLFEAGSAVCGAAPTMDALIIGRVVAGVGGSGMYSGTLTYVSVLTSAREKPAYLAGSTVVWGIGSVLGPVVGGAFAESAATWRWGFYINLVIGAIFAPAYLLLFPAVDPQPAKSTWERLAMIDWAMTVIFLAGAACLTLAISFGGVVYSFSSGTMIALWSVTGVLLIVAVAVAKLHPGVSKENRLYPVHFLRRPILVLMQAQVFLSSGIVLAMTYYVPLYFQFVRGDGPLDAGVRLLPLVIFLVVFSMINGVFMPRLPYYGPWYIVGSVLVLVGSALMCTVGGNSPNAPIYGFMILVGAGAGCYIVAGFAIVQSLVPAGDTANAVGAMTISQDLGMVLFLAIAGSLFQNIALDKIMRVLPNTAASEIVQLMAGTKSPAYLRLSPEEQSLVVPEITASMKIIWVFFTVAAAISFLLSLPLIKQRLRQRVG